MEQEYFAFISYSRKDKKIANWLHSRLENYAYPQNLVNQSQRPQHAKYLRPIFLDTKDMQVEERPFTERIQGALKKARFLILICSGSSAKSTFVDREVRFFLEHHDNNYALIVPLFVDDVHGDTTPPSIAGTSIMHRHFPIYSTQLSENSELNSYCFYQIAAYLLGVNFPDIYDRYEQDNKKKTRQVRKRNLIAIVTLVVVVLALGVAVYQSHRRIEEGRELIKFEKKVFPAAVVFGYEENFLSPVVRYLKESNEDFRIYVLMPTSYRGLHHQDRIADINYVLKKDLNIDSLGIAHLATTARRGSHIHRLMKDGEFVPGIYLDFASTTTSFFKIAEYKMENPAYQKTTIDEIIDGYTKEFVEQTKHKLEGDSVYVEFLTDKDSLVRSLRHRMRVE